MNEPSQSVSTASAHHSRRVFRAFLAVLFLYFCIAYLGMPRYWQKYETRHPALTDIPGITHAADDIPGDPLNIGLIGTEEMVHRAMSAAKWYPADPITFESSLRIAADVVLAKPFDDAPVSPLFLFGRKQDLAFEQPIGNDPRRRHHVRFWKCPKLDEKGRPLWIGAATLDTHVGLSYTTGQITHHIGPDVDLERDKIIEDLKAAGVEGDVRWINDFHKVREGRNGGGDPWHTDGRLAVAVLAIPKEPAAPQRVTHAQLNSFRNQNLNMEPSNDIR
ncbi:MAG TPA: LssY C-terminal domain-containing protein [Phycisphaerae bacterium]|nr:LssY C-terminal domain-containing protein [Phycisphaerae bacterium]